MIMTEEDMKREKEELNRLEREQMEEENRKIKKEIDDLPWSCAPDEA